MMKTRPARPDAGFDRHRALAVALLEVEKYFGRGAVWRLAADTPPAPVEVIPTGSLPLDLALGVGGLPRGRITEVYGPEASGKTTLALSVIAQCQRAGGQALFVDAEHALDLAYARAVGVDLGRLHVCQPDSGEQALETADLLIRSGGLDLVVVDSVAALVPRAELDGEIGDSHAGLHARMMAQALRKLAGVIATTNTTVVFLNQLRDKLGILFGNPEGTTGGRALRHHASVRLDVRRVEALKDGETVVGARTRVKVVKNKVAAPYGHAELDLLYSTGISYEGGLLDLGLDLGLVTRAGPTFTYGDTRIGQGREQARGFLRDHPDLTGGLDQHIRTRLGLGGQPTPNGLLTTLTQPRRPASPMAVAP